MAVSEEAGTFIHLHLSDNGPVTEEELELSDGSKAKVLWKDVLVEGEYPMSPGPDGATRKPMRVIAEGESDAASKTISMSDIIEAHEDGAFKYVTIPTSHRDGLLDNTGYVPRPKGVRIVEKNGKKVMQSALGFTEPEIKGKVERGTIPDVSAGIFFNWLNKHTAKRYRAAMKHVALTPVPFMGNLDPFPAVFASDDADIRDKYSEIPEGTQVEVYDFADSTTDTENESVELDEVTENNTGTNDDTKVDVVWNERDGASWLRSQIEETLRPTPPPEDGRPYVPQPSYYVTDVSPTKNLALVEEFFKGDRVRYVIPFTVDGDDVKPAPATRWVEVREAMVAASDSDFEELSGQKLRERLSVALSEQVGPSATVYRVDEISLDNRMRIVNNAKGKSWIAEFALLADNSVWVAPTEEWEAIEASDEPNDAQQPASSKKATVVLSDDESPEAKVQAARQRRRQLLAS